MDRTEFAKRVNESRKANKNKWYTFTGLVEGKQIAISAYNTYLNIFRVDGVRYGGMCDISVKKFNEELMLPFK
jgi:hypothetical protein